MAEKMTFEHGKWITSGIKGLPVEITKKFSAVNIAEASVVTGGFGTFRILVNGKTITEDLFLPLNTDFEKRYNIEYGTEPFEEEFAHRLYCPVYDIKEFLTDGENEVTFLLAPGFYEVYDYGTAKICFEINLTDNNGNKKVICSDGTVTLN